MGEVGKGITSFKKGPERRTDEIEKKRIDDASKTARDITPETDKDNGKDRV